MGLNSQKGVFSTNIPFITIFVIDKAKEFVREGGIRSKIKWACEMVNREVVKASREKSERE